MRNRKLLLLPVLLIAGLIIIFTNTDEPPAPTLTRHNPEVSPDRPAEKVSTNQVITTTAVPTTTETKADAQAQVKGLLERALMHNDPEIYSLMGG